ncbi:hypothetical protein D5086_011433 [Populus alba]|uniref:Uncharacterized protein n=1 Tax=Populus alba TaxID=43335 RepID=A0ACC4CC97_POPAL
MSKPSLTECGIQYRFETKQTDSKQSSPRQHKRPGLPLQLLSLEIPAHKSRHLPVFLFVKLECDRRFNVSD